MISKSIVSSKVYRTVTESHFKAVFDRTLSFALLWWALAEGDEAWWFGLPVIAIALSVSLVLRPKNRWHWRPAGLARFVGFFLWQSLRGGVDVARRALHPRMPLAPAFVTYPLRLSEPGARVCFANTISLLPGTLSADLEGRFLRVHVLDDRLPVMQMLQALEARVAALFGEPLSMAAPLGGKSDE